MSDIADFSEQDPHHILSYDKQYVILQIFHKCSFIISCALTNRMWVITLCSDSQCYYVFPHDNQFVSAIAHPFENTISLLPVLWQTQGEYPCPFLWQAVASILLYCKTGSEWQIDNAYFLISIYLVTNQGTGSNSTSHLLFSLYLNVNRKWESVSCILCLFLTRAWNSLPFHLRQTALMLLVL